MSVTLAFIPVFTGFALVSLRTVGGWHVSAETRVVTRVVLIAVSLLVALTLALGAYLGFELAKRHLPDSNSRESLQFIGAFGLGYGLACLVALAGVLGLAAWDAAGVASALRKRAHDKGQAPADGP